MCFGVFVWFLHAQRIACERGNGMRKTEVKVVDVRLCMCVWSEVRVKFQRDGKLESRLERSFGLGNVWERCLETESEVRGCGK